MKIAIVEDELTLGNELAELLINLHETDVLIFESGESFLFAMDDHPFDLVFMDIQMSKMNGLETAKVLREKDKQVAIVFLTNDPSFVFEGYEVDAIRYWMKPVEKGKLAQLLDTLQRPRPYLLWTINSEIKKIYHDELLYLESDGHYVIAHMQKETQRMKAGFKEICQSLSDDFIPIHRSYCININYVHALLKEGCQMDNGEVLAVSRTMKPKLQETLMRKCREELPWNF